MQQVDISTSKICNALLQNIFTQFFQSALFLFLTDYDYTIQNGRYCTRFEKMVSKTTADAKRECYKKPNCGMMYDNRGHGNSFYFCTYGTRIKSGTQKTILYIRDKGKLLQF